MSVHLSIIKNTDKMDNSTENKKEVKKRSDYGEPKFYLDKLNSDKLEPIFLRFTFAPGKRISYYTGERIAVKNWSLENQRVNRNVTGGSEINDILNVLFETAKKAVRQAKLLKKELTIDELKTILDTAIGKEQTQKTNFFDVYDRFVNSESVNKSWTIGTRKKIKTIRKQLIDFETYQAKKDKDFKIRLAAIDETFFQKLISFWQEEYDHRNTTIQKHVHILKWFFNWCNSKELMSDKFKKVKIDLKGAEKHKIIYLDLAEIGKIYRLEIPPQKHYLDRTRDIFVFGCLTGLRFSDIYNLKASDIQNGVVKVTAIKTGENLEIDLNDTTSAILAKYSEHQAATGKALPVPVNQVYNKFLKELAELTGLNERITLVYYQGAERIEKTYFKHQLICSHTARRSFITNGLAVGIGSEVLRSWTGHKSEKSFRAYYEIIAERKKQDIQKFKI